MKKILMSLCFLCTVLAGFVSCEDDDSGSAQPVIKYIRPTEAAKSDSLLVRAPMGTTIAIIGEGLADVTSAVFNDQKAKLNPVYITDYSIIVTIPGTLPEVVTNTLTLTTSGGKTCTHDFIVGIPVPKITSMSCEWAPEGSTAILYGSYFFPDFNGELHVNFPGNLDATVIAFNDVSATVVVPAGASSYSGRITVTNDYGTGRTPFIYRDDSDIFIDAENPSAWNNWNLSAFATDGGVEGAYINFEGSTGSWAWPANAIQLYYNNPNDEPLVTEGDVANYSLKFECYSHEWHDTPLLIWFANDPDTHNVDGTDAQYHWKPYIQGGIVSNFTTNGWITVELPLSEFKYSKDESENSRKIADLNELVDLHMMWFGAVDAATTEFGLKVWIDNIRLVKTN
jgi:hypothetical protein